MEKQVLFESCAGRSQREQDDSKINKSTTQEMCSTQQLLLLSTLISISKRGYQRQLSDWGLNLMWLIYISLQSIFNYVFSTEGIFHIGFMIPFNGKPEIYGAVTVRRKPSVNSIISRFPSLLCVSVRLLKHSEENDSFSCFVAASSSLYTPTDEDTAINFPHGIRALPRQPPKHATYLRIHWERCY